MTMFDLEPVAQAFIIAASIVGGSVVFHGICNLSRR